CRPYHCAWCSAIASRSPASPGPGGYWLRPARIASTAASDTAAGGGSSGKPCPRFSAPCVRASADIRANTLGCTCPSFNRPAAAAARVQGPVVSMASSLSDTGGAGGLRWRSAVRSVAAKEQTDAVVNGATSALRGGGGVDGAIHRAGGPDILAECRRLRETSLPDGLPAGRAVATTAGRLPARWVIHTVGPVHSTREDRSA